MNPITLLDSILSDWASPRVRRLVHALIALVLVIVSAVMAADGDFKAAALSLAVTIYAAINKANTPATDLEVAGSSTYEDDGLTYEEAGGLPFAGGDGRLS